MSEGILANEEALSESFTPDSILHRQGQIKEIARCLAPALTNRSVNNVLVTGQPGSGKTLVVKWILSERFERNSIYINCWNCRSEHMILEAILQHFGFIVTGRESTQDLVRKMERLASRKIIVCLDEVDQIRQPQVLYTLARYGFGLIMISNHSFLNWDLDGRIKSSLILNEVEFKPYSKEELYDIINQRVSFALRPGSITHDLIRTISVMAEGDARVGLLMLKASARNAEARSANSITLDDVKASLKGARRLRLSYLLKKLNEHQRVLYDIMKKRIRITSGDLYKEYRRSTPKPLVDRAYRRHMQRMIQLGLVKEEGLGRWKHYEIAS